jgi:hypothetical protein
MVVRQLHLIHLHIPGHIATWVIPGPDWRRSVALAYSHRCKELSHNCLSCNSRELKPRPIFIPNNSSVNSSIFCKINGLFVISVILYSAVSCVWLGLFLISVILYSAVSCVWHVCIHTKSKANIPSFR